MSPVFHPRKDDLGRSVALRRPSRPTPPETWTDARALACVVPDGPMPAELNGVPVRSWSDAPGDAAGWETLAEAMPIVEPPWAAPAGLAPAAGAVIREPDGRFWVVAPSNAFGGYRATFPKGRLDGKSHRAAALVEVYEETGLRVRLLGHLTDLARSQTYTRFYLAERIGGNPADMGWESQAVMLVPWPELAHQVDNPHDRPLLAALEALGAGRSGTP